MFLMFTISDRRARCLERLSLLVFHKRSTKDLVSVKTEGDNLEVGVRCRG
jgi:hypothetical protein